MEWETVIEICTTTEKKSDGRRASERRLYVSSLDCDAERLSLITRRHWAIESMHWDLDRNLQQDRIKRKTERAARNLDTIQRMVLALIAAWKNRRKKSGNWHSRQPDRPPAKRLPTRSKRPVKTAPHLPVNEMSAWAKCIERSASICSIC